MTCSLMLIVNNVETAIALETVILLNIQQIDWTSGTTFSIQRMRVKTAAEVRVLEIEN